MGEKNLDKTVDFSTFKSVLEALGEGRYAERVSKDGIDNADEEQVALAGLIDKLAHDSTMTPQCPLPSGCPNAFRCSQKCKKETCSPGSVTPF